MRSSLCNRRKSHNIWLQIKTFDWNVKLYKLHCLRWICPCLSCLFPCQYLDLSMFIMFIPPVNTWIFSCLSCLFPCQYLDLSMYIMFIPLSIPGFVHVYHVYSPVNTYFWKLQFFWHLQRFSLWTDKQLKS